MRIVTVVGARPQFIKAAPVSRALRARPGVEEILVHTGQHYDENMSDVFFAELEIPKPDRHLGVGSGSHGAQTGRMLEALEQVLGETRPDHVLIFGDTNSTLAAALAAAKLGVPVEHVEAGLRSFNRGMPEEINRVVADHLSHRLFAPTETAVENLRREGIAGDRVHLVGDVMYDAALHHAAAAERRSRILETLGLAPRAYVLATIHRAENTDSPARLGAVFGGLAAAAAASGLPVILPLHPRTRTALARAGIAATAGKDLRLIDPVGYLDMVRLEKAARLVVTDSGGVQKEAFFHRVPCVTLRDQTEWVELVAAGWNRLVSPVSVEVVAAAVAEVLAAPPPLEPDRALYGAGAAAERIAAILCGA